MKLFFVVTLILLCLMLVDSRVTSRFPRHHIRRQARKIAIKQCGEKNKTCIRQTIRKILKTERRFRRTSLKKCKCRSLRRSRRESCITKCLLNACSLRAKNGCSGNKSCASRLRNTCVFFHLPSLKVKSIKKVPSRKYVKNIQKRAAQACKNNKDKQCVTKYVENRKTTDKKLLQKVRRVCVTSCNNRKHPRRCNRKLNKCVKKQVRKSCQTRAVRVCVNAKNKVNCSRREIKSCRRIIRTPKRRHVLRRPRKHRRNSRKARRNRRRARRNRRRQQRRNRRKARRNHKNNKRQVRRNHNRARRNHKRARNNKRVKRVQTLPKAKYTKKVEKRAAVICKKSTDKNCVANTVKKIQSRDHKLINRLKRRCVVRRLCRRGRKTCRKYRRCIKKNVRRYCKKSSRRTCTNRACRIRTARLCRRSFRLKRRN